MGYKRGRKYAGYVARARFQAPGSAKRRRLTKPKRKRLSMKSSLDTHSFSRFAAATTYQINDSEQPISFEFKLNSLLGYTEFQNLFDKYKVTRAQVWIQLITNPDSLLSTNTNNSNSANNWFPKLWYISDHDDSGTTTISALKERVGVKCRVLRPNSIIKMNVKPAIAAMMYATATTTGYGPRFNQYIDMSNPEVPHYGLKTVVDCLGLDPLQTFTVRTEYKLFERWPRLESLPFD